MKRILLTGASGRLGRYVLTTLNAHDYEVRTFDKALCVAEIDHVQADILDSSSVQTAMKDRDVVIHLAALDVSVSASEQAFFEINVQGTWNVLEAAEQAGVQRVVLCSSVAALGIDVDVLPDYLPIDERHPCRPRHAYGLSKQIAETIGQCFARRGAMEVVCLRPAFVVFPDLVGAAARALAEHDGAQWSFELPGDVAGLNEPLTATRSFVAPVDAAACFLAAVEAELSAPWGLYLVAAPWSMSPAPTMIRARVMGIPSSAVRDAGCYRDTPNASMFSCSLAERELGWRAECRFEELLNRAVRAV